MKTATIALALLTSISAYGQWSVNNLSTPPTIYTTTSNSAVAIGTSTGNPNMRISDAGAETMRFGSNPFVRLFEFDFNHQSGASQSRNGASMRIDLRFGAPDNFNLPVFVWYIRGDNEPIPNTSETQKMYLDKNGVLAIGHTVMFSDATTKLQVNGNGKFTGNITADGTISGGNVIAKYQDVAEWVPASEELAAATVVVLDPERPNHVVPSSTAYDETVAGVVSARPGIVLGEASEEKVKVATTGRVKVKVDATGQPIRIGDLLVTSDKPGVAMKSERIEVSGVRIHRPGTIVGKALEPLAAGQSEILVLLSLQ
ncbi:MAG TPA: hypothetical protein VJ276_15915 [Thermoanaerobaculia bacterium]|nr:hypothetical protein [Thermoanaerobaculia bacterium]